MLSRLRVRLDIAENWKLKLKTEKHCSKIIFKCVNSTVGLIFNEKVAEKYSLWDPWTVHESIVYRRKVKKLWLGKKKKNLKHKHASGKRKTHFRNALLMWSSIDSLTVAWSIENYDFRISRFEIRPSHVYLFRIFFSHNLRHI